MLNGPRHLSRLIILAALLTMAGTAKASASDGAQVLTGAAAKADMIRMTLAEQDLDGDPAIDNERVFPDCAGSVTYPDVWRVEHRSSEM